MGIERIPQEWCRPLSGERHALEAELHEVKGMFDALKGRQFRVYCSSSSDSGSGTPDSSSSESDSRRGRNRVSPSTPPELGENELSINDLSQEKVSGLPMVPVTTTVVQYAGLDKPNKTRHEFQVYTLE